MEVVSSSFDPLFMVFGGDMQRKPFFNHSNRNLCDIRVGLASISPQESVQSARRIYKSRISFNRDIKFGLQPWMHGEQGRQGWDHDP